MNFFTSESITQLWEFFIIFTLFTVPGIFSFTCRCTRNLINVRLLKCWNIIRLNKYKYKYKSNFILLMISKRELS